MPVQGILPGQLALAIGALIPEAPEVPADVLGEVRQPCGAVGAVSPAAEEAFLCVRGGVYAVGCLEMAFDVPGGSTNQVPAAPSPLADILLSVVDGPYGSQDFGDGARHGVGVRPYALRIARAVCRIPVIKS